jgi:signal transduction histidine kinase
MLALVSWWVIGRALRPVESMRRQAAAIPGDDLRSRLDVPAAHDELGRLSETFNELLERIAAASDRQRRFVDDAAHELRSPLAALKTRLEVGLRHPQAGAERPDETAHAQRQALKEITRLVDLVNDLLSLARMDAGRSPRTRPVDLDDLVWSAADDARRQGSPKIDTTGISPVRVHGDVAGLRRVVRNLLDNARRHASETVTVKLGLGSEFAAPEGDRAAAQMATLVIADDGPGIPVADRQRVFDRFVRLDEGRARDSGGSGLGLAIVSSIVAEHGGRVWVDGDEFGATFVVQLPVLTHFASDDPKTSVTPQNRLLAVME